MLDDGLKADVEAFYKVGYTPLQIMRNLGILLSMTNKIRNFYRNHRKTILYLAGEVVTKEGWIDTFGKSFSENICPGYFSHEKCEHEPFVLAIQFATKKAFVIAFSTPSLMKNMVDFRQRIVSDADGRHAQIK